MTTLANGLELLESDSFDNVEYPYSSQQYPGFEKCVLTSKGDQEQLWVTFDEAYDRLSSFGLSEDFLEKADAFIDEQVQQAVIKGRKIFFKIQEINSLVVSYLLKAKPDQQALEPTEPSKAEETELSESMPSEPVTVPDANLLPLS